MQLMFADVADELANTRKVLERVPDGKNDWKPHDKSSSLGLLATHLAELSRFGTLILTTDELDWGKNPYVPSVIETTAKRLAVFDELTTKMQADLAKASWDDLSKDWTLHSGDHILLKSPKGALIRTAGMSHMTHHRAQLGVYLRLLGVPVPRIYGPTADEPM